MSGPVSLISGIIAYPETSIPTVVLQLLEYEKSASKTHVLQTGMLEKQLESERQILEVAIERYRKAEEEINLRLELASSRSREEAGEYHRKALAYTLIQRYGPEMCIEAYEIAENDDENLEERAKDSQVCALALDLLRGRYFIFFSEDMQEWVDFARVKRGTIHVEPPPVESDITLIECDKENIEPSSIESDVTEKQE